MAQNMTADIYHEVSRHSEGLLSLLLYILCRIHALVLLGLCDQSDAVFTEVKTRLAQVCFGFHKLYEGHT